MEAAKILLMYAGEYEMKDDDGRIVEGCVIQYFFFGQNGEQISTKNELTGPVGYQRAKCSVDKLLRQKIIKAPAIYDASFTMNVGSDGKPILKISDLKYAGDVDIKMVGVSKK